MRQGAGFATISRVHPDSKGRITLGALAKGVSSYRVAADTEGRVLLEPYVEIPARERWLWENRPALESVLKGIEDAAAGRVGPAGSPRKLKSTGRRRAAR